MRYILFFMSVMLFSIISPNWLEGNIYGQSALPGTRVGPDNSNNDTSVLNSEIINELVTLSVKDSSLNYVLRAIARQINRPILFDDSDRRFSRKVSVQLTNSKLVVALKQVLQGTGLVFAIASDKRTIIIRADSTSTSVGVREQDNGTVSGVVMDSATKKGIVGVRVRLEGTPITVITDDSGGFTLSKIPSGKQKIGFKLIGYRSQVKSVSIRANEHVKLDVMLTPSATVLNEVVTSVTGMQRKIEIGNDVTSINVDSVLRTAPVSNVTDLLETRVPGLTVIRSSGVPGSPSRLRLRGLGGGLLSDRDGAPTNDPIVIVDGIRINASQSSVNDQNLAIPPGFSSNQRSYSSDFPPPSSIDQIDPNSIDKIEVFKGPSAAALYGSDAANGVIVITTKRGKAGPTKWSLSASQDIEYLPGTYVAPGYYPFCHGYANNNSDGATLCSLSSINSSVIDSVVRFQALNETRLTPFGMGHGNALTVGISGGNRAYTYSITGSISNTLGLLKMPDLYQDMYSLLYDSTVSGWMKRPNQLRSRNMNATFVSEPTQGLQTTLGFRVTYSKQRQSSAQLEIPELASVYIDTLNVEPSELFDYATRVLSDRLTSDYSLAAHWDRWRALSLTGTLGISRGNKDDNAFFPRGMVGSSFQTDANGLSKGYYSAGSDVLSTQTARFNGTTIPFFKVSTAFGVEVIRESSRQFQAKIDSLPPGVVVPTVLTNAFQRSVQKASGGWFVEPRINLNSRFFVNPGFRFDGNNTSGSRSGSGGGFWSLFPRLNFSWLAIDQGDRSTLNGFITMLRPRASFGIAGSQPAAGWQLRLLSPPGVGLGTIEDNGLELSTLGNTQLHPERTREIEGGFDIDMWDNRISLSVTYYNKLRKDAIEQITLAPSVYGGGIPQYQNIGRIRNTGTELTFSSILIENQMIRWSVNMSLSKHSNKVLSLSSDRPYISNGEATRIVPGYPLNGRWSRPILGYAVTEGRLSASDIIVGDSAVYVGQQLPNFELPVSTGLSLLGGQLSFNATLHYKDGLTQFNRGNLQHLNNLYFNPASTLDQQAVALAARCLVTLQSSRSCTEYGLIQTINSLRLSSVSIGYNVPRNLSIRYKLPSIQIALQGSNLALWTNYRGKDPDVNSVSVGDITIDGGQLPQPRTWRFQVRLGN